MPSPDDLFNQFVGDVYYFVRTGHKLPFGLLSFQPIRSIEHGGRMTGDRVEEFFLHNKRKVLGPLAGTATGFGVTKGLAMAGVTAVAGAAGGPATAIALGVGVTVSIVGLVVVHGIRAYKFRQNRKELEDQDLNNIDVDKLTQVVGGGEMSNLARSFEKAWKAGTDLLDYRKREGNNLFTCKRNAEYAWRLLYFHKRILRLFNNDDLDIGPENLSENGDHRLRNIQMFVELVPRKAYAEAESALDRYGRRAVEYMGRVRTGQDGIQPSGKYAPTNHGLLRWKDWAAGGAEDWARFGTEEGRQSEWTVDRPKQLARILTGWTLQGASKGDTAGLVTRWVNLVDAMEDRGNLINEEGEHTELSPLLGHGKDGRISGLKQPISLGLNLGVKPAMSLVMKELVNYAVLHTSMQAPTGWAHGITGGAIGLVPSMIVGTATDLIAESLNSKLNMAAILNPSHDPVDKVWLLRSVLEFGGVAAVTNLRQQVRLSIGLLDGYDSMIAVRKNARAESERYLQQMITELYRLHNLLIQLSSRMFLWDLMLNLINAAQGDLARVLVQEFHRFKQKMVGRLANANSHQQCKTICYYATEEDEGATNPIQRD